MSDSNEAKLLMNSPVLTEALDRIKQDALSLAMACDPRDDYGRRCYLDRARIVDGVYAHLTALVKGDEEQLDDPNNFYVNQAKGRFARILELVK